jgi:hypothetical protein
MVSRFRRLRPVPQNKLSASLSFETLPPLRLVATVPWANGIKGSTGGVEPAPVWKASTWLELKGSYSYLNMDLQNKPGNTDAGKVRTYEGPSPPSELSIRTLVNLPSFEFDPAYRCLSALPGRVVKSYSTIDILFAWRFAERFRLSIVGQDLLQPQHAEFAGARGGLIGLGRSAYAKVVSKSNQDWP